jgi:hypothetical protein
MTNRDRANNERIGSSAFTEIADLVGDHFTHFRLASVVPNGASISCGAWRSVPFRRLIAGG